MKKNVHLFFCLSFFFINSLSSWPFAKKTESFGLTDKLPTDLQGQIFRNYENNLFGKLALVARSGKYKKRSANITKELEKIYFLAHSFMQGSRNHIKWGHVLVSRSIDFAFENKDLYLRPVDLLNIVCLVVLSNLKNELEHKQYCQHRSNSRCLLCHLLGEFQRRGILNSFSEFLSERAHFRTLFSDMPARQKERKARLLVSHFLDQEDVGAVLIFAMQKWEKWFVKAVLDAGVDVNYQDKIKEGFYSRETALHFAVRDFGTNLLDLLLKYGPNLEVPDSEGQTALGAGIDALKFNAILTLLRAGSKVENVPDGCIAPMSMIDKKGGGIYKSDLGMKKILTYYSKINDKGKKRGFLLRLINETASKIMHKYYRHSMD